MNEEAAGWRALTGRDDRFYRAVLWVTHGPRVDWTQDGHLAAAAIHHQHARYWRQREQRRKREEERAGLRAWHRRFSWFS